MKIVTPQGQSVPEETGGRFLPRLRWTEVEAAILHFASSDQKRETLIPHIEALSQSPDQATPGFLLTLFALVIAAADTGSSPPSNSGGASMT